MKSAKNQMANKVTATTPPDDDVIDKCPRCGAAMVLEPLPDPPPGLAGMFFEVSQNLTCPKSGYTDILTVWYDEDTSEQ
jgi:hypothetical protein